MITGWRGIDDLILPPLFMKFIMGTMNRMREDNAIYSDTAFDKIKTLILILSQVVVRGTTAEDRERIALLQTIPEGL